MNELQELYQEIILDHNKRPRNFRQLENVTHLAQGHNPLCGDELTIYLRLSNGTIEDVSFQGEGCAISKASASLMTSQVKGKSTDDARREISQVVNMLTASEEPKIEFEEMGDLASLSGIRQFPVRVKCATLAWHALEAAIEGKGEVSTE